MSICFLVAISNHSGFRSCLPSQLPLLAINWTNLAISSMVTDMPAPPISTPSGILTQCISPIPRGSNRRGFKNSVMSRPVFFLSMAQSMLVPAVLYMKWVPGSYTKGWCRN